MNPIHIKTTLMQSHTTRLAAVLIGTLMLAACASDQSAPDRPTDTRQAFPITVSAKQKSLSVNVTAEGTLASRDEEFLIRHFVREYLNRGRNELTLEVGAGNLLAAERIGNYVNKLGVPRGQIAVRFSDDTNAATILSFTGNTVQVPDCGDWSESETFNWDNSRSPNFGCSMRRNIGLMVTDPGDLVRSKPSSGHSARKGVDAINSFNAPDAEGGTSSALTQSTTSAADAATE